VPGSGGQACGGFASYTRVQVVSNVSRVESVAFVGNYLVLYLVQGGLAVIPLTQVPLLKNAPRERDAWEIVDGGTRIAWPALNHTLNVEDLLRVALPV